MGFKSLKPLFGLYSILTESLKWDYFCKYAKLFGINIEQGDPNFEEQFKFLKEQKKGKKEKITTYDLRKLVQAHQVLGKPAGN